MPTSRLPLPFELSEYHDRLARTRARMDSAGIDVLVVTDEANMRYLTAYGGRSGYVPQCVVVTGEGEPDIALRTQDMANARHTVWMDVEHIHDIPESFTGYHDRNGWQHIASLLRAWGHDGRRIALEGDSLQARRAFESGLPNARLTAAGELVAWVRAIKSDREIAYKRTAGRIGSLAVQAAIDAIGSGVRQCDVAAALCAAQVRGLPDVGGDPVEILMPFGDRTDAPHLNWSDERIVPGTAVNIETGGAVQGYESWLSRSVHVGPAPDRLVSLHAATLEAMEAAFDFIRPGVTCEEVDAVVRRTTTRHGYLKESRCGYMTDGPSASFHPGDRTVLEPNMTFHLMLGMWQRHGWGLVLSEAFRVTETGIESFIDLSRELFVRD